MKPKKEFMLVRLHQTPEKPTRISKPLRSNLLSDMSNQPSSRDLGIFIARNNPTDASGPAYFIAKIMPDGLVKRYTINRLFTSSQWQCLWASETWFQFNIHFLLMQRWSFTNRWWNSKRQWKKIARSFNGLSERHIKQL